MIGLRNINTGTSLLPETMAYHFYEVYRWPGKTFFAEDTNQDIKLYVVRCARV